MEPKEVPILSLTDVLKFGKHKGQTVEHVIRHDSSYVDWCLDNRIFSLDEEADDLLCEKMAIRHFLAEKEDEDHENWGFHHAD